MSRAKPKVIRPTLPWDHLQNRDYWGGRDWVYTNGTLGSTEHTLDVPSSNKLEMETNSHRASSFYKLTSYRTKNRYDACLYYCFLRTECLVAKFSVPKTEDVRTEAYKIIVQTHEENSRKLAKQVYASKWVCVYKKDTDETSKLTPVASMLEQCYMNEYPLQSGKYVLFGEDNKINSFENTSGGYCGGGSTRLWRDYTHVNNWLKDRPKQPQLCRR